MIVDPYRFETDAYFASVKYLLHFDGVGSPQAWPDVIGNTWTRATTPTPDTNLEVSSAAAKFGAGSLKMKTIGGVSTDFTLTCSPSSYSLGTGNKFTLEAWMYWTGNVDSRNNYGEVLDGSSNVICGIVFYTTNQIKFRTFLNGSTDDQIVTPPLNQWVHVALTYDGTTKRWFVNGALTGSSVLTAGAAQTVASYKIRGTASGNAFAPAGYMDDLRFTAGVCRYTGAFTPPTQAFPNQ